MKEKWNDFRTQMITFWQQTSKKQRALYITGISLLIIAIITITIITSKKNYVALPYNNLSLEEVGQVKEELDSRNVDYIIEDEGTTIKVPDDESNQLIIDLAGQGIPQSNSIDYSFFSENATWGVTDNEFSMMKLDAMQTELANLIKGIDGIDDANVMITLPEESVFIDESNDEATASIVLQTDLGFEFEGNQIETLHHLVASAVPDLSTENISIMNQYFEYFDEQSSNSAESGYEFQQSVKKDIEQDIQTRLQQMLGAMLGNERVVVSVTADVDYTDENRVEELVEPVDVDNMEGIPLSIENIHETFEGSEAEGGVAGTGEEDIPNYPAGDGDGDGDYELVKDTVNYELNRIRREIAENPYKLRDLGIQVVVDNMMEQDGEDAEPLTQQEQTTVEEGIESILDSMITTSIDKEYGEVDPEEKISIVFQPFNGMSPLNIGEDEKTGGIPIWAYVVGAVVLILVVILIVFLIRRRNKEEEIQDIVESEDITVEKETFEVPNIEDIPKSEVDLQKEQVEKMAKEQPEEFAKLLRGWMTED